jgi:D12 class N6 adenine-specific DNA methyltransferase
VPWPFVFCLTRGNDVSSLRARGMTTLETAGAHQVGFTRGRTHCATSNEVKCSPLLKWPGGKRSLLGEILPFVPSRFNRFFEPFLGGGALFFALQPTKAYLSDKNGDLIHAYSQVRDCPDRVIRELRKMRNSEKDYYKIRSAKPTSDAARAARLIYLVTLAFNGIYRVNLRGEFNVPYGYKTHLKPCDEVRICETSELLKGATIREQDFEETLSSASEGDLAGFLRTPAMKKRRRAGYRFWPLMAWLLASRPDSAFCVA